jgi:hypothetical protein
VTIDDIRLEQTCDTCPEQYDAYVGEQRVAYLRLRWGHFRVEVPFDGKTVLSEQIGDGPRGAFADEERDEWLTKAKQAILDELCTPKSKSNG